MLDGSIARWLGTPELRIALDREEARRSLIGFVRQAWPILEPGRTFVEGWPIGAIAEHLEAVTRGEIKRLLMNVPPGSMKSLLTRVFWPAWEWGPQGLGWVRYIGASYAEHLALRDNRRARLILNDPWFQQRWPDVYLSADQRAKGRFENNHKGWMQATSVEGLGTGERGDRFIIDDPHNVKTAESEATRESTLHWFSEVVPSRLNSLKEGVIVVIMQRVHDRDVSGFILEKELGYEHLMIPMEYEPERKCYTSIGWQDPRERPGELMWPERFSAEDIARLKKELSAWGGTFAIEGQLQQRPVPRGGGLFKKHWFKVVPATPAGGLRRVRAWDLAATVKEGGGDPDYTVGILMALDREGFYYIEDMVRLRDTPEVVERAILSTASRDGYDVRIRLPQDPGQAGKAQISYLTRRLAGYHVDPERESGSKITRTEPFAAQVEAGNVYLVDDHGSGWNDEFLNEVCRFPRADHDDTVDAATGAFRLLTFSPTGLLDHYERERARLQRQRAEAGKK